MVMKKIKKIALLILVFLFFMCGRSQQKSFDNLTQSFFQWYFKINPVVATKLHIHEHSGKFAKFDTDSQSENLADLKRFIIELSQIDRARLSRKSKIDYDIFTNALDELVFNLTEIKESEWNPLLLPKTIGDGISYIVDNPDIPMNKKVDYIKSRLNQIPVIVHELKSKLTSPSKVHTKIALSQVKGLLEYLLEIPLIITSDNSTLDSIDDLIKIAQKSLEDYYQFLLLIDFKNVESLFRLGEEKYKKKFSYVISDETSPEEVYQTALKSIEDTQNQMFLLSLPFYLLENDEPVWVDRSDTLDVINWTINSFLQEVPTYELLSEKIDNSLIELENFIKVRKIVSIGNYNNFLLLKTPAFKTQFDLVDVETIGSPDDLIKIHYYVQLNSQELDDFDHYNKFNDILLDLINMNMVYPGYLMLEEAKHQNYSQISRIFDNDNFNNGWMYYCEKMMIEARFRDSDSKYKLFQLYRFLQITIEVLLDQDIHIKNISKDKAIKFMVNQGFYSKQSAEENLINIQLNYCDVSSSFVGSQLFWNLRKDVESDMNKNFDLFEFHEKLLSRGSIPLKYVRDKILN